MVKSMKKNVILMLSILAVMAVFAVVAKAEVISPMAKNGLVANGEKQVLVEAGKLTDGDEVDRYFRYKFEKDDDAAYTKDANLITATDAGEYLIEWQLISTKDGGENVLDAGLFKTVIYAGQTKPNVDTGNNQNNKLMIGIIAFFSAAVILLGAVAIKERIGGKNE